jgi:hypothetical protein
MASEVKACSPSDWEGVQGKEVDMDELTASFDRPPPPDEEHRQAITDGDEHRVQRILSQDGPISTAAKQLAISSGNPGFLPLLLQRAPKLDDGVVVAAVHNENREAIRVLLDHGWPINQRLRSGLIPSMLR